MVNFDNHIRRGHPSESRAASESPSFRASLILTLARSHVQSCHFLCHCRGKRTFELSSHAANIIDPPAFANQLAIAAWLTSRFNAHHNYLSVTVRDRTRFLLFTSAWTIVFSFLFMILFLHSAANGSALTSVGSHGLM